MALIGLITVIVIGILALVYWLGITFLLTGFGVSSKSDKIYYAVMTVILLGVSALCFYFAYQHTRSNKNNIMAKTILPKEVETYLNKNHMFNMFALINLKVLRISVNCELNHLDDEELKTLINNRFAKEMVGEKIEFI